MKSNNAKNSLQLHFLELEVIIPGKFNDHSLSLSFFTKE